MSDDDDIERAQCGHVLKEGEDDCDCCLGCGGSGYIEDGGCGGGCDFCRPFPKCGECDGSGRRK